MTQSLARQYRPASFNQVVGHEVTVRILSRAIDQQKIHPAYLLTGTRGVGKTSIARIIAKCLNCQRSCSASPCLSCPACSDIAQGCYPDLIEIDAASRTKVEDTRALLDDVHYAPVRGRYKIYLIDEVHMLSNHSFNALLKTLEEPPTHTIFILATTDPQKIPETILSRCLQFHLSALPKQQIIGQLQLILTQEGVSFESAALGCIADQARGSLRDALSLLDQILAYDPAITTEQTAAILGIAHSRGTIKLLQALAEEDAQALIQSLRALRDQGQSMEQVLQALLGHFHSISLYQFSQSLETEQDPLLSDLATQWTAEQVQLYYQIVLHCIKDMPHAPNPAQHAEITCLRLLAFTPESANTPAATARTTENKQAHQTPHNPSTKKAIPASDFGSWTTLCPQLPLTGLSKQLAMNSRASQLTPEAVTLHLPERFSACLNPHTEGELCQALQTAFKQSTHLTIHLEKHDTEQATHSPAEQQASDDQTKLQHTLDNDQPLQSLLERFDAKITQAELTPSDPRDS